MSKTTGQFVKVKDRPKSRARTAYGLLSEIRRCIVAEPKRYDQGNWLTMGESLLGSYDAKNIPSCETVGCVAGWALALKYVRPPQGGQVLGHAQILLGLDDDQAEELFKGDAAIGHSQTLRHAKSGARHIARFQKKYAKQLKAKAI